MESLNLNKPIISIDPKDLGSETFKKDFNLKFAYFSGAMYRGIASKELVVKMGLAGFMGFLGTAGLTLDQIERDIDFIQKSLDKGQSYGMNLLCHLDKPDIEINHIELFLKKGITCIEAAAFMQMTPSLVLYHLKGLKESDSGAIIVSNKIIAKVSRPETAAAFMSPAPKLIVDKLLSENKITSLQAALSQKVPMSNNICLEADSGGHTDQGKALVLLPAIKNLRDEIIKKEAYLNKINIGLAGGIGSPEAIAAAFIMGADFICTGSINQCTVEAGTSDTVKDMLQTINIQDTDYAPAGDMFKIGARVQVLKKGTFFSARGNKLFMLYNHYDSIDDIPEKIRVQIQEKYFLKSFDEIFRDAQNHLRETGRSDDALKAETDEKYKMELIFCWYFHNSMKIAFEGDVSKKINFQIHTGPALGAFNQSVKGTALEKWNNRHVDHIANKLMNEAALLIDQSIKKINKKRYI
ncbi:PfaD family polyunsaturated fatty acid/polyketide biosynthesis protein [Gammaproteobacteria bacterium]|nr:PfaD family polyunsaturated fatty acid/polyketide biosynthesis protein [Gammaproteobacteria bacterium]